MLRWRQGSSKPKPEPKRPSTSSKRKADDSTSWTGFKDEISGSDGIQDKDKRLQDVLDAAKKAVGKQLGSSSGSARDKLHQPSKFNPGSEKLGLVGLAYDEAVAGFRPKAKKRSDAPTMKGPKKANAKLTLIYQLILLPYGLDEDGELIHTRKPTPRQLDILRREGYALRATAKEPLSIPRDLETVDDVDAWLCSMLGQAFDRMDLLDDFNQSHLWSLLTMHRGKFQLGSEEPNTVELRDATGGRYNTWQDRALYFTSTQTIPDLVKRLEGANSSASKKGKKRTHDDESDFEDDEESDGEQEQSTPVCKKRKMAESEEEKDDFIQDVGEGSVNEGADDIIVISDEEVPEFEAQQVGSPPAPELLIHSLVPNRQVELIERYSSPPLTSRDPWAFVEPAAENTATQAAT
ncbi:hypothetical protein M422DRAFT_64736 [Sphaerobolus stellatus SS14]|nr:hypothetical protein M422DRAFT_64736 [Sphaerobolus stellatus SS14]